MANWSIGTIYGHNHHKLHLINPKKDRTASWKEIRCVTPKLELVSTFLPCTFSPFFLWFLSMSRLTGEPDRGSQPPRSSSGSPACWRSWSPPGCFGSSCRTTWRGRRLTFYETSCVAWKRVETRSFSSTVVVKQLGISDFEGGTSMYFNNITMFSRYIGPKIWVPPIPIYHHSPHWWGKVMWRRWECRGEVVRSFGLGSALCVSIIEHFGH